MAVQSGVLFSARLNSPFVLRRKSEIWLNYLDSRLNVASLELTRTSRGFRTAARAYVTSRHLQRLSSLCAVDKPLLGQDWSAEVRYVLKPGMQRG